MGYDVHICRTENWTDSADDPITLEEWLAYVRSDPEMRLDGEAVATTTGGETIVARGSGLTVWTAYSKAGVDGGQAWFDHSIGCIDAKNPDAEILDKMSRIARKLRARVQGDDGEFYDE